MGAILALLVAAAAPLTRSGARDAAQRELAKPGYQQAQPPWWYRPLHWVFVHLRRLWDDAAAHTGGSAALAVLTGLLLLVVVLVAWRVGPLARTARVDGGPDAGASPATATDHRNSADRLVAQGRFAEAVRERLRAISRDLEERTLIDRRRGRTAYEMANEAGRALPEVTGQLGEAADLFSRIWYGGVLATAADAARLAEIDDAVQRARPVHAPAGAVAAP